MKTGLLLVGHGSRRAQTTVAFESLCGVYRDTHPALEVAHGYVELAAPPVREALAALAQGCQHVVVLPLFLFAAGHVKNDLPLVLAQARRDFPGTRFSVARALGVHPDLVSLVRARVAALVRAPEATAVIVVGRGSSDPDANGDFCKLVRLVAEGTSASWVVPCFVGIARPLLDETLAWTARARPGCIVVVPYLLFAGRLSERIADQVAAFSRRYPWIRTKVAAPLGLDERVFRAIDERLEEVFSQGRALPCDTCQYRVPINDVVEQVGGLRALLWSLRHGLTHSQAMPHEHAHSALRKHVLVCGNVDCAHRGSVALIAALRRLLKATPKARDIRVTRTHCMGRCGEGPTVAVYPDGVWYRGVQAADAEELVQEHLLGDRLLGRLVDNIMQ